VFRAQPAASQTTTMDLGAGYKLVLGPDGGQIIPPTASFKAQPAASQTTTIDLGAGYSLVLGPDGGKIVREGSR
jgi:hypothetical protein